MTEIGTSYKVEKSKHFYDSKASLHSYMNSNNIKRNIEWMALLNAINLSNDAFTYIATQ